ncbi:MAG: hypothetical protein KAT35_02170 [Candidatus Aenigmarchaeota archaeon]|nr:hypothetical protein [Candidatus Aenigmarchaeota archaeon]
MTNLKVYKIDLLPQISDHIDDDYLDRFKSHFGNKPTPLFFFNMISFLAGIPTGRYVDSDSGNACESGAKIFIREGMDIPEQVRKVAGHYLSIKPLTDYEYCDNEF